MRIRDLLKPECINLHLEPQNKDLTIASLVNLIDKSGCLVDSERFRRAVLDRESKGTTALGEGVAIPHAKSAGVKRPALAAAVIASGTDFDSLDGKPTQLIFLIASPHHASNEHLDVLAHLSSMLIDENFRKSLIEATSVEDFLKCIDIAEGNCFDGRGEILDDTNVSAQYQEQNECTDKISTDNTQEIQEKHETTAANRSYDLVAVTACPAGLSHTYMAAEALEHKAREMGLSIKVETDGAAGNRNKLLPEEIAKAKAVIVAADRAVTMDRFVGKKLIRTGVVDGVRQPENLIKMALDPACPVYKATMQVESSSIAAKMYRHLMSGLTYILPLVATAGILSSLANFTILYGSNTALFLDSIGTNIGSLIIPVFAAFIAFSMAGRTGLVAGFTGGIVSSISNTGILGALVNGFVGGSIAFLVSTVLMRLVKGHDALLALLFYPLIGAIGTTIVAQVVVNPVCSFLDTYIYIFLTSAPAFNLAIVGAILAGMMAADMGGPFNKLAYACGVLMLANTLPNLGVVASIMGTVMLGGMVPPIAAGLASIIYKKGFSQKERELKYISVLKGLLFITEAVIPYMQVNPLLMRLTCIAGAASAGAMCMYFKAAIYAPHGGIFVIPISNNPLAYVLSLCVGVGVSTILCIIVRYYLLSLIHI